MWCNATTSRAWNALRITLLVTFLAPVAACASGTSVEEPRPVQVFILAGQSNMDGRGDGSGLSPEDRTRLAAVRDRVQLAYNGAPPAPLDVTRPLPHIARKFGLELTFGPELFFAIEMAEAKADDRFLLIKRSRGGTSLYGCWNPDWQAEKARLMGEEDQPKLYSVLIDDIETQLSTFEAGEYTLAGMLWVQGEADSGVKKYGPKPAERYGDNLRLLIDSIRADLDSPDLPFLLLQVGGGKVVEGMREVSRSVEGVYFIPQSHDPRADNYLPKYGPPLGHYNYEGMKRIGELFATTFLRQESN